MVFLINDLTFLNIGDDLLCVCLCFDSHLEGYGKTELKKKERFKICIRNKAMKYNFTTICFFVIFAKPMNLEHFKWV